MTATPRIGLIIARRLRRTLRAHGIEITRFPVDGTLGAALQTLLRITRTDVVLDVGAHHGEFGHLIRSLGYRGQIISFEPVTESVERLATAARRDAAWSVVHCALGSADERRPISISAGTVLSSLSTPTDTARQRFGDGLVTIGTEDVTVEKLDTFWSGTTMGPWRRPFLKIDTQGWDFEVLRGAEALLPKLTGVHVELDVEPLYVGAGLVTEVVPWLQSRGLVLSGIFPVVRDADQRLLQVDAVFVRTPHHAP